MTYPLDIIPVCARDLKCRRVDPESNPSLLHDRRVSGGTVKTDGIRHIRHFAQSYEARQGAYTAIEALALPTVPSDFDYPPPSLIDELCRHHRHVPSQPLECISPTRLT
jgi:hypothetical protein